MHFRQRTACCRRGVGVNPREKRTLDLSPADVPVPETASDDPRVGHLIQKTAVDGTRVVLIGFGSDEGVRRNGGRTGAAGAPDLIRSMLYRLTPDTQRPGPFIELLKSTVDVGNVRITGDVEADQAALGDVVACWLDAGAIPVILGGGHETSYGHFLGYVNLGRDVEVFNVDAHADVRPLKQGAAHSGSPFFQALTHPGNHCRRYTVFGLQPWSVAASHLEFLDSHGCRYLWRDEVSPERVGPMFSSTRGAALISMDMDAVNQSEAPGVSAPSVNGLQSVDWLQMAFLAGRHPQVGSFDLVEVNPQVDVNGRTVRLAACTVWQFLKGLSERF